MSNIVLVIITQKSRNTVHTRGLTLTLRSNVSLETYFFFARMRTRKYVWLAQLRQILMLSNNILDRRRATLGATNTCHLIRVLSNSRVSLVGVDGENVCVCVCVWGGGGGLVQVLHEQARDDVKTKRQKCWKKRTGIDSSMFVGWIRQMNKRQQIEPYSRETVESGSLGRHSSIFTSETWRFAGAFACRPHVSGAIFPTELPVLHETQRRVSGRVYPYTKRKLSSKGWGRSE